VVSAFFAAGYFGVGLHTDPARARTIQTALDARIPFIAGSVWIYLGLFPTAFLPLFVVRCRRLFRRTILAYALAIAASVLVFAAFPVTSSGLRVDAGAFDLTRFAPWAVALLYRLDPPYNLFPSLHLSIALLAAASAWKASRPIGAAAFAGVVPIAVSICTVKQHFVLDALGGAALAAALYAIVLAPYEPAAGQPPAFGRRGLAGYAGLLVVSYAALYATFLLGGSGIIPSVTRNRTRCAIVSVRVGSGLPPSARLLACR